MAKLLKPRNHKIAPRKMAQEQKKIVLVGTYAGTQLTDWPGYYPYPITADDKVDAESCAKVNEMKTREERWTTSTNAGGRRRVPRWAIWWTMFPPFAVAMAGRGAYDNALSWFERGCAESGSPKMSYGVGLFAWLLFDA